MNNVRPSFLASFAILTFALAGLAGAADKGPPSMRELIQETLEQLAIVESSLYSLERMTSRDASVGDARSPDMFSGSSSAYRDLKRATEEIARVGQQVQAMAKDCSKDHKDAASLFRGNTRRLQSNTSRIATASSASFAHMALSSAREDANELQQSLGTIGDIEGCADRPDEEDDNEKAEKSGGDDKPGES